MSVWCVRANSGHYAKNFHDGGYVAVDYEIAEAFPIGQGLEAYEALYEQYHPGAGPQSVGQNAGLMSRFGEEIQVGDCIITPSIDADVLYYGSVVGPYYFEQNPGDDCEYRHRLGVGWIGEQARSDFSNWFRSSLNAQLAVFSVSHELGFLTTGENS